MSGQIKENIFCQIFGTIQRLLYKANIVAHSLVKKGYLVFFLGLLGGIHQRHHTNFDNFFETGNVARTCQLIKILIEFQKFLFINDGIRLWNRCPSAIKQSKSLFTVKKEIKKIVVTLPI